MQDPTRKDPVYLRMMDMLADDAISSDDCLDYYIDNYEDTDIMTGNVVEDCANALGRSPDPDDIEQSKRLLAMLDANPKTRFFDYYNEKPIDDKNWLKAKFGI